MHYNKKIIALILSGALMLTLFSCSKTTDTSQQESTTSADSSQTTNLSTVSESDMFTDRDYNWEYDESSAVNISLSDAGSSCSSSDVSINADTVTIKNEGVYVLTGSLSNGQIQVDTTNTSKVQLVLKNANINCNTSAAIYVLQADKVFITCDENTENSLSNSSDFVAIDDNNIDGVVFSKDDLTFNGTGTLNITAKYGHSIVSKNDIKVTCGTYNLNGAQHCIQGKDSIRIAGGVLNLTAGEDALHSENNDEDNTESKGYVYIIGGEMNIAAGDDGIHAGKAVTINDATINITKSYEGIEGETITINGGDISLVASDDGLNAASGDTDSMAHPAAEPTTANTSCYVTITGGKLFVNAGGDGLDSNGSLNITGGEVYVEGPTDAGNGALDYDTTGTIDGGTFIALGSVGMAMNFTEGEQCSMLVNISGNAGETIEVKNSSSKTIFSYTAQKQFTCAVISVAEIEVGETYTISTNSQSTSVTMTDTIYGATTGMNGGMGGMGGMGGGMGHGFGASPF